MKNHDVLIDGVKTTTLKVIQDDRGAVMHMLKDTDEHFERFGEIYFSMVDTIAVKAWHRHKVMTLNYACIYGRIQLALFDDRPFSPTQGAVNTIYLEGFPEYREYKLITIPPMVWNGFRADLIPIGERFPVSMTLPAIVANCATHSHDPDEIERASPDQLPLYYDWGPYEVAG